VEIVVVFSFSILIRPDYKAFVGLDEPSFVYVRSFDTFEIYLIFYWIFI